MFAFTFPSIMEVNDAVNPRSTWKRKKITFTGMLYALGLTV